MNTKTPRVFISYSHDSREHMERVLGFSNKLRGHGVEAIVDKYFEDTLDMRWTDWMNEQIEAANFVLIVATSGYLQRMKPAGSGAPGQGANWEGALITQDLYELHGYNARFFAVWFDKDGQASIPKHLRGFPNYDIGSDESYIKLYRRLTNQPGVTPPPVGAVVSPTALYPPAPSPPVSSPRQDAVKQRIEDLARAYQELRKLTGPGDARTRKMEVIAARMRALGCDAYFLLDYLAKNPEPGWRLAAVSLLETKPNPEYLDWLAERLAPEKPFVGYRAAVALLIAARTLEGTFRDQVRDALEKARGLLGPGLETTDRGRTLRAAYSELEEAGSVTRDFSINDRPLPI